MEDQQLVEPEILGRKIDTVSRSGRASGALEPIPTRVEVVEDSGVSFLVHVHTGLVKKAKARLNQKASGTNPFLPPDPDLLIGNLSPTHCLVLNKFNVFEHHVLIVTREYVSQDELLTVDDLAALASTMCAVDGLGFYNGGTIGGASQPHRHLQLVPVPFGQGPHPTPVDSLLRTENLPTSAGTVEGLPFAHAVVSLKGSATRASGASLLHTRYLELLEAIGIDDRSRPYNLLVTRRWMMVVPRSREHWGSVSVNALGFAGSLLVRDNVQLERLRRHGPMAVLRAVAG